MLHIQTDNFQFAALSEGNASLLLAVDSPDSCEGGYAALSCGSGNELLIAYVYKKEFFPDISLLTKSRLFQTHIDDGLRERYSCLAAKILSDGKIAALWLCTYPMPPQSGVPLVPVTLAMYSAVQFMRHLRFKKTIFGCKVSGETARGFSLSIEVIDKSASFLYGNISANEYAGFLRENGVQNGYAALCDILAEFPEAPKLNGFRKNILAEITAAVGKISEAFLQKDYKSVREIAYGIHNLPEIIRTMNDYR